ncbi:MAG: AAA family ATPase [Lachnospiraceae bacterium]|nr:AAA family ATPase [Lachnospiraceae bacterium]MBQ1399366.1 AAA family ATPase [Lachnospiraceae bacterium]MBQ1515839.1 AAA family ATPase [Lachnospiraceae bacterium]MBQ3400492.1 AAA family ATPase [Lachnospiraceae bacterium]MBQ4309269.1 AAA family ATPase [Lachnospiraceae bacterium]
MKIAVTGKGGVGKTTFAAVLARLYAAEGRNVLCADVDPDANLGLALGFSEEELEGVTPISEMKELVKERTCADEFNKFFKINPKVDDLPDRLSIEKNGVKLLVMGTIKTGGMGCVCPEHVMIKRLLSHMIVARDEVVVLDMEAGLEHLARGTTDFVDCFIVVIEPGARSVQTYHSVKRLAEDLGVKQVLVVANKVRDDQDEAFIRSKIPAEDLLGVIRFDADVAEADRLCESPYVTAKKTVEAIRNIKEKMEISL